MLKLLKQVGMFLLTNGFFIKDSLLAFSEQRLTFIESFNRKEFIKLPSKKSKLYAGTFAVCTNAVSSDKL